MEELVKIFMQKGATPKYVFGINTYTDYLLDYLKANSVTVKGIIDNLYMRHYTEGIAETVMFFLYLNNFNK